VVISDFLMPHMDGVSFLSKVGRLRPAASLILLAGHADRARVEGAVRETGLDPMEKPWSNDYENVSWLEWNERTGENIEEGLGAFPTFGLKFEFRAEPVPPHARPTRALTAGLKP
jgi:two-component SAPR family response regulator